MSKTTPTLFWPFPIQTLSGFSPTTPFLIFFFNPRYLSVALFEKCFLMLKPHFGKGKRNIKKEKYVTMCCWEMPASCPSACSHTKAPEEPRPSHGGRWLGQLNSTSQWHSTSSPVRQPGRGWRPMLFSSFPFQLNCWSHSYDSLVISVWWDHLSHEVDEENCNHRLDGTKNCLVLDSLPVIAVLGFRISGLLFFFSFPLQCKCTIQGPLLWRTSSMYPFINCC